jgi:undecaprenyl diphosphate synthase
MKKGEIPTHVGIILDGNRRWAKKNGLPVSEGHREGFETFNDIATHALDRGIKYLTIYAFSTENWSRTKEEVSFLMGFAAQVLKTRIKELHKKGVRFVWLGSRDNLDESFLQLLTDAEELTKNNDKATLALCFNYGGQQEIVDAVKALQENGEEVSKESIEQHLYGGAQIPAIDFLIRTSGEHRISNFMLWRTAYSELYFTDILWPDFHEKEFDEALAEYATRQRRFGV